jgi:hypothetical protein
MAKKLTAAERDALPESDPRKYQKTCECGWERPHFADVLDEKKKPLVLGEFWLVFDCPKCGARWEAHYGQVS